MQEPDFAGIQLIMLAGKGEVGKTTCSAALASHFARRGEKTLLFSSAAPGHAATVFETPAGNLRAADGTGGGPPFARRSAGPRGNFANRPDSFFGRRSL